MKTKFLNVDLEIKSSGRLRQIEKEFEESGALMLFSGEVEGRYLSTFEVGSDMATPDLVIVEFSRLINGLSEKAKNEWNEAKEKIFDVGYESSESIQNTLNKDTKRIIEKLGGSPRYTTYQPTDSN